MTAAPRSFNIEAAPLPEEPFDRNGTATTLAAYKRCRDLELRTLQTDYLDLVCVRFLGYLLVYAPYEPGRDYLANQILQCSDDQALYQLGLEWKVLTLHMCELLAI